MSLLKIIGILSIYCEVLILIYNNLKTIKQKDLNYNLKTLEMSK